MPRFELRAPYEPRGDQPAAIEALTAGLAHGRRDQVLLGVTGSGKTFAMANLIARTQKPALVLSHNKTLAAQLYAEFRQFFPENAVQYFVSYYDYYQPESYIPARDIYIEKDAAINEDLDRLRLAATAALMSRPDVLIVASVSCIYGLGSPDVYARNAILLEVGQTLERRDLFRRLVENQYARGEYEFKRGTFRVRGDALEIYPAYDSTAIRVELDGDAIARLEEVDPLTGEVAAAHEKVALFPAKHYVLPEGNLSAALDGIRAELAGQLEKLRGQARLLEAQRLELRTRYDLEMLEEVGYCKGIENYSRHLDGRPPGSRPFNLMDFFPKDGYLLFVDESHVSLPQVRGMYNGDCARKTTLVEHGFRLPSALDNRPMRFDEFELAMPQTIYVSATPGPWELARCRAGGGAPVEMLVRPTGLVDPPIAVRPTTGQVADLLRECRARAERSERVLITTLTKRMAEDLSAYLREAGLACRYLHSEIDAIERVELLKALRLGQFDVLVGVNLLREGLDLPEVALVAVLDADKEGFLRSQSSLIQTIGRAARNLNGAVLLYADKTTAAMRETIAECARRREKQLAYNRAHGITPVSIRKAIQAGIEELVGAGRAASAEAEASGIAPDALDRAGKIKSLEEEMERLAEALRFEEAAGLRDRILDLQGLKAAEPPAAYGRVRGRRRRSLRAAPSQSERGMEAPAPAPNAPNGRRHRRR